MRKQKFPLYQHAINEEELTTEGNQGLRFDRFFKYTVNGDKWAVEKNKEDEESNKVRTVEKNKEDEESNKVKFLNNFNNVGEIKALRKHAEKQIQLLKSLNGEVKVFATDGHLVTGMGNPHPVENGMLWHHTLGVPYLSGSQVKGLVRSAIELYYYPDENDKAALLHRWFGSDAKDSKEQQLDTQAGAIIFFDALPIEQVSLTVDIMTPHMKDWYAKGAEISDIANIEKDGDKIPADWHKPTPIPFLAIKKAKLLFTLAARTAAAQDELKTVWEVLEYALNSMGIGAKTQTGYGYLAEDTKNTANLQEAVDKAAKTKAAQQQLAASNQGKSALFVELNTLVIQHKWLKPEGKNDFDRAGNYESWVEKLKANPDVDTINLFKQCVDTHHKGLLENPDKTQGKKNKPVYKDRQRKLVAELNALLAKLS